MSDQQHYREVAVGAAVERMQFVASETVVCCLAGYCCLIKSIYSNIYNRFIEWLYSGVTLTRRRDTVLLHFVKSGA